MKSVFKIIYDLEMLEVADIRLAAACDIDSP